MFERPASGERAVLVNLSIGGADSEPALREFRDLARSAGVEVVAEIAGTRVAPDPAHFAGKGKVEEIRVAVESNAADVALFNHALTPGQERNLERLLKCRVVDRTGVILDIFAQRARTFEGKLQVELAQLRHMSTRLIRGWTHLERQKGGIGLRGPGETQLEVDRRLIERRIHIIHERLERVRRQRRERRRSRRRAELPTVSLVGYTNAGKSTLFNRLTGARSYVADRLFATLDPSLRRLELPGHGIAILSDTVGFISDLPHDLVAAFRATLEEAEQAQLLLVVVDAADVDRDERLAQVYGVLDDIGAGEVPRLEVFNQIDRLPGVMPHVDADDAGCVQRVWLSAATGAGVDALTDSIAARLAVTATTVQLHLPARAGRLRARLYEIGAVDHERPGDDGGTCLDVTIDPARLAQLCRTEGLEPDAVTRPPPAGVGDDAGRDAA